MSDRPTPTEADFMAVVRVLAVEPWDRGVAIHAMAQAIADARAAGRRVGIEEAALACERRAVVARHLATVEERAAGREALECLAMAVEEAARVVRALLDTPLDAAKETP